MTIKVAKERLTRGWNIGYHWCNNTSNSGQAGAKAITGATVHQFRTGWNIQWIKRQLQEVAATGVTKKSKS